MQDYFVSRELFIPAYLANTPVDPPCLQSRQSFVKTCLSMRPS